MAEVVGVAYPVPYPLLKRILDEGKTVFVKHPTCFKKLEPGMKVLFYASREVRAFLGEATVKSVELMTYAEAKREYGEKLFISEKEARDYSRPLRGRRSKTAAPRDIKFLVLALENVKKYERPVKPKRFVTVGGKYVTKEEYERIAKEGSG